MDLTEFWAPVHITGEYGDPRPGGRKHRGTDWSHSTRPGTPIPSLITGTVTSKLRPAFWHGFGNQLTITTAGRRYSFAHLQTASPFDVGDTIGLGQILGQEGSTGAATGPCVHVEVYQHGWHNPAPIMASLLSSWAGSRPTPITDETEYNVRKLYKTDGPDKDGRRHALVGETTFQTLSLGAAQEEWDIWPGPVIGVDARTWHRIRIRAEARAVKG